MLLKLNERWQLESRHMIFVFNIATILELVGIPCLQCTLQLRARQRSDGRLYKSITSFHYREFLRLRNDRPLFQYVNNLIRAFALRIRSVGVTAHLEHRPC